jgi:hypothetical protein
MRRNKNSETISILQVAWIKELGKTFEKTTGRVGPDRVNTWAISLTLCGDNDDYYYYLQLVVWLLCKTAL